MTRRDEQPGATHEETEQKIVRMIREGIASHDAQYRQKWGRDPSPDLSDVQIEGSYPDTWVKLLVVDGHGRAEWQSWAVWKDPDFLGPDGGHYGPAYISGQIMMLARGG
jgi:hypothetical protein